MKKILFAIFIALALLSDLTAQEKISAQDIQIAYKSNPILFDKNYVGKRFAVTGKLYNIVKNGSSGDYTAYIESDESFVKKDGVTLYLGLIEFQVSQEQLEVMSSVKKGDKLTVVGTITESASRLEIIQITTIYTSYTGDSPSSQN